MDLTARSGVLNANYDPEIPSVPRGAGPEPPSAMPPLSTHHLPEPVDRPHFFFVIATHKQRRCASLRVSETIPRGIAVAIAATPFLRAQHLPEPGVTRLVLHSSSIVRPCESSTRGAAAHARSSRRPSKWRSHCHGGATIFERTAPTRTGGHTIGPPQ